MIKSKIAILLLLISFGCKTQNVSNMNTKIDYNFSFELDKYLGTWYEIARFDHSFEKNLQGVTANYTLRKDGKIKVINQGFKDGLDGKKSLAEGQAKIPNIEDPRRLKVSFFWIFYADYFILELDKDYQYAVIGSSSPNYLWLLSRTPIMEKETLSNLLQKLQDRGYNTDKLIWVEQKSNK